MDTPSRFQIPVRSAPRPAPSTVSRIARHHVTIESPTSRTEELKKKDVQRPQTPAPWKEIGYRKTHEPPNSKTRHVTTTPATPPTISHQVASASTDPRGRS